MMDLYLKCRIIGWIIRLGILAIAILAVVAYGIYLVKIAEVNSAEQLNDDLRHCVKHGAFFHTHLAYLRA